MRQRRRRRRAAVATTAACGGDLTDGLYYRDVDCADVRRSLRQHQDLQRRGAHRESSTMDPEVRDGRKHTHHS
jgi:hypothetical protein